MKIIQLFLLSVFAFSLQAQDTTVPNEYMLYFKDGTTQEEVNEIADEWDSNVLVNIQPGVTNVALLSFYGSFPMVNPYDPNELVYSLIEIVGKVKRQKTKGDGGGLNYILEGHAPGIINGNCYDENLLLSATGEASFVSVAVFDSGTNWDMANQNGFNFGEAYEINGDATDKNGHGTHVASIVNKTYLASNNGNTTTAVQYALGNPLGPDGTGTLAEMIFSMEEAINHGANVINCSFSYMGPNLPLSSSGVVGPESSGLTLEDDVLYLLMSSADPTSTLFVVSAGNNNGIDLDAPSQFNIYPAAFPLENMITVASYSCVHELSTFSNFGAQSVDLAAPGEDIVSIDHEMNLVAYSGTSQAAAYVSGAASILGTYLPVFDAAKVKCAILNSAKFSPTFNDKLVTEGFLDIPKAVAYINSFCADLSGGGLSQLTLGGDVDVNPTVFTSDINIAFDLETDGPVDISIYSLNGQMIFTKNLLGIKGSNEISLNLGNLPTRHTMFIRIVTDEYTTTSKIIKAE